MLTRDVAIAGRYVYSRLVTGRPFILTHAVTGRCNCRCGICDCWRRAADGPEMETGEVFQMQDEASSLGFVAYIAFGGEPLLRSDLGDLLRNARDRGLYTVVITNGYLLKEQADMLAAYCDLAIVSLDDVGEAHDALRDRRGIFDHAAEGIAALRARGARVAVNCVLSRASGGAGRRVAAFAEENGLKVAFDPVEPFPGINDGMVLADAERRQAFGALLDLKKGGAPVLNSEEFLAHQIAPVPYRCAQPRIFLRVSEDGTVRPFWCRKSDGILGNARTQPLAEILASPVWKAFTAASQGCSLCTNSSTVESSLFYYAGFWASRRYLRFAADYAL
jgi:MoaA/NifB/PqqE/SkfB family radical SAM enzyme